MRNKSTLKIAEEQFLLRVLAINGLGWSSYRMDRELTVQIEQVIATLRKHVFASFQYITLKLGKLTDSKTLFLAMLMDFRQLVHVKS